MRMEGDCDGNVGASEEFNEIKSVITVSSTERRSSSTNSINHNPTSIPITTTATDNPLKTEEATTRTTELNQSQPEARTSISSEFGKKTENFKVDIQNDEKLSRNGAETVESQHKTDNSAVEKLSKNSDSLSETCGPVPNFRLEGSGTGDSSITVALTSFVNSVTLSNSSSLISGCEAGDLNTESGPISIQSSEDMKLSLVSWYSEPDDPSRAPTDSVTPCCGGGSMDPQMLDNGASSLTNGPAPGTDEKENKIPELIPSTKDTNSTNISTSDGQPSKMQRIKMHVKLFEANVENACSRKEEGACRSGKAECPRCTRRSKSGSATPASATRIPGSASRGARPPGANRRLLQSSKSSTELKKPIKSILKSECRGSGGSGSGSDIKSSMDSLGSGELLRHQGSLMTKSDSGARAKFNLNHQTYSSNCSSDDKDSSRFRRIEKYATLRLQKASKSKPLATTDRSNSTGDRRNRKNDDVDSEIMSKSMSFLEKGHLPGHRSTTPNSSLTRQGSLRMKRSPSAWEPCTTRTTALRMQKMQEAKQGPSGRQTSTISTFGAGHSTSSGGHSGSAHSGSGESIHHILHNSEPKSHLEKVGRIGAKVFSKLSSAMGQTASSNQKRLKQDKAIQVELPQSASLLMRDSYRNSVSPVPKVDGNVDVAGRIRQLEELATRYRNTALRFQTEFEKSEAKNTELIKQLEETRTESNEMIEFLQTEKETLADSLVEIENEVKNWRIRMENESKSSVRDSNLVELKKEKVLRSKELMSRLELECKSVSALIATHFSNESSAIQPTESS